MRKFPAVQYYSVLWFPVGVVHVDELFLEFYSVRSIRPENLLDDFNVDYCI
jgi:hypothetical protein